MAHGRACDEERGQAFPGDDAVCALCGLCLGVSGVCMRERARMRWAFPEVSGVRHVMLMCVAVGGDGQGRDSGQGHTERFQTTCTAHNFTSNPLLLALTASHASFDV